MIETGVVRPSDRTCNGCGGIAAIMMRIARPEGNIATLLCLCVSCRAEIHEKTAPQPIAPVPRRALQRVWDLACEMSHETSYHHDDVIADAIDTVKKFFKLKGSR